MDEPYKPFQFGLRMLLIIAALIASIVACVVAYSNYNRNMNSVYLLQNGPAIKEVERWQEEYKKQHNGKPNPGLERIVERLKRGEVVGEAW